MPSEEALFGVRLGGLTPFTTIDFPGSLAAVLFTQGCSWRCGYCQNPSLWSFEAGQALVSFEKVSDFLKRRRGLLDGVVICGGEPTEQAGLPDLLSWIRRQGYKTGLHTNGSRPQMLQKCLSDLDWVGLDFKAPLALYDKITRVAGSAAGVRESLGLLAKSGIPYEVRATYHPDLLSADDLEQMARELAGIGIRRLVLQAFRPQGAADKNLRVVEWPAGVITEQLAARLRSILPDLEVRI